MAARALQQTAASARAKPMAEVARSVPWLPVGNAFSTAKADKPAKPTASPARARGGGQPAPGNSKAPKGAAMVGPLPETTAASHTSTPLSIAAAYSVYGTAVLQIPTASTCGFHSKRKAFRTEAGPPAARLRSKSPHEPSANLSAVMVQGGRDSEALLVNKNAEPAMSAKAPKATTSGNCLSCDCDCAPARPSVAASRMLGPNPRRGAPGEPASRRAGGVPGGCAWAA
mmetsp:Transcript_15489/g.49736  ORF Transcript_15489/g.49736 Transcript_15489/m.49736 type:complete len:228 (+) Transcript_15489:512-1195(+)